MLAEGTFTVKMKADPPYLHEPSIMLSRAHFDKVFDGALQGNSAVEMLGARTAVAGSAGYVAMEFVRGSLDGRKGSFALQHSATMTAGQQQQSVAVVPDSATGELTGLRGRMAISIIEGIHHYKFEYDLIEQ